MTRSPLLGVALPRRGRTRQVTSFGRDPERGGTFLGTRPAAARRKRVLLLPGETHTMARIEGPGLITRLWMTVMPFRSRVLRELVLRIYWDGESAPSVECPFGDFFGVPLGQRRSYVSEPLTVANGAYISSWPMPFGESARIEVSNDGPASVDPLFYQVTWEELSEGPPPLRFHAQWRRENPTRRGIPYRILEARGAGQYAGCHVFMQNREWWLRPWLRTLLFPYGLGLGMLEGRLSIRVDEEAEPSIAGTGTEDDFNGAWYNLIDGRLSTPSYGCTMRDVLRARVALYRLELQSPVPFRQAVTVTLDHGIANELTGDYASVAYWYQAEPHAAFPSLSPPPGRKPMTALPNLLQSTLLMGILMLGVSVLGWAVLQWAF